VRIKTPILDPKKGKIVQNIGPLEEVKIESKKREIYRAIEHLEAKREPVTGETIRQFIPSKN
jgi:hypothetical protein